MTDDVALREVTVADLPTLFEQQLDPESVKMAAVPARNRPAFDVHWAKVLDDATVAKQVILFREEVAGYLCCFERDGRRLVGYWIGKEFWGKGIATRALTLFLGSVRERPLFAHVAKHNRGSIRVLEKCGFVSCDEGTILVGGREIEELLMQLG